MKSPRADDDAKVNGIVVIVGEVPAIGELVNVRIAGRLDTVFFPSPPETAGTD